MISNATLYRIPLSVGLSQEKFETALAAHTFTDCGLTQEKSTGFVPCRGDKHGALLEVVAGQWIMKVIQETRAVPGQLLKRKLAEKIEEATASTGRKPGRKETAELKEDIKLAMLPAAFARQVATLVWIDPATRTLLVGSSSRSQTDDVLSLLIKAIEGFAVQQVNTTMAPATAMALWIATQEPAAEFSIDAGCEIRAGDGSKAVVRYSHLSPDREDVRDYLKLGYMPTRMSMTWTDQVSFILTDSMQLKQITCLDSVFDGQKSSGVDEFDADVAIYTGVFQKLLPALIDALGGEIDMQAA